MKRTDFRHLESLRVRWAEVFGGAACLSSTFGYQDDLFERIAREPKRSVRLYLDSGWPRDNFASTNAMRDLLVTRGYELGRDLQRLRAWAGLDAVTGPGIRVTIVGGLDGSAVMELINELRNAGAEAISNAMENNFRTAFQDKKAKNLDGVPTPLPR